MNDPVLDSMARQLRARLIQKGLDPQKPPAGLPPTQRVFEEYKARGGSMQSQPDQMTMALVERVREMKD